MLRRRHQEIRRRSATAKPPRYRVGFGAAAGAVAVAGMVPLAAAAPAHADFDALFEPIVDAVSQAAALVDPAVSADLASGADLDTLLGAADVSSLGDPFAALDALVGNWFQTLIADPFNELTSWWVASPLGQLFDGSTPGSAAGVDTSFWSWLFGDGTTGASSIAAPAAADGGVDSAASSVVPETVSVPLRMQAYTEPVVDVAINGGSSSPVLVDTGSAGLVLPIWDIGLQNLSFPTGWGMGAYSGGLGYVYLKMPATVDFGDDLITGTDVVTGPTSVNAVIFTYPTSVQAIFDGGGSWTTYFAPAGVDGVLGIGPNAVGPTPDAIVTSALPGSWGQGVLIDQANGVMQFGPNPLTGAATVVNGAPNTYLAVSIDGGPLQHNVASIIDSGGVFGTMPSKLLSSTGGTLPVGTEVSVYTNDGSTLLYSYTISSYLPAPEIISSGSMNTGNYPFAQQAVYISSSGQGATIFEGITPP